MIRYRGFEDLLQKQAKERGSAAALVYECDQVLAEISYAQLYDLVLDRSRELARSGKTCLGVLCDGSTECVITVFGSVLGGLQTVLLDSNASEELLRSQIAHTDVDLLWGDPDLVTELEEDESSCVPKIHTEENETSRASKARTEEDAAAQCAPQQERGGPSDTSAQEPAPVEGPGSLFAPAPGQMLFFTSGTTSACKAVVLTDSSLMASAYNGSCMLPLTEKDRLLCMLPLNHVFGFVCSLLWGLSCGAQVALGRGMRHYADDPAFFEPTVISLVPMLLGFLLKQQAVNAQLEKILVGAGDCPPVLLGAAQAQGIHISFGYGLTETSSGVAISTSGDPFALSVCPDDTITLAEDGEIMIQAPTCMMQGYYKMPEETAKVLRGGVLFTGDLGRFDESGALHVTGRKKEMLVLPDGTKVFLPEYEAAIRSVLGEADMAVAQVGQAPVLFLHGNTLAREEIIKKLSTVMAGYPRGQQLKDVVVLAKPLPRTATGKVKRWELAKQAEAGR